MFRGHTGPVSCLATDADGKVLFTASTDATVRSWVIDTGAILRVYEEHQGPVVCMTVC